MVELLVELRVESTVASFKPSHELGSGLGQYAEPCGVVMLVHSEWPGQVQEVLGNQVQANGCVIQFVSSPDEFETPLEGGVHPEDSFQTFNLVGVQFRPPDLLPLLVILDAVHEEFRCRLSATAALGMVHQTGHCKLQLQQVRRLSAPSLRFRRDAIKDQIVQVLLGGVLGLNAQTEL